MSQNFLRVNTFACDFLVFLSIFNKSNLKKIVEEITLYNFGKRDFERTCLEIDQIHYQNKYPYKIFVTPKARFSRKVCFNYIQGYCEAWFMYVYVIEAT